MKNKARVTKLERVAHTHKGDRLCFCQLYPNYQGCNGKEYEEKVKSEDRELEWNDIYNMGKPKSSSVAV